MSAEALKLTVYFGERARARGGYLADALSDLYARHRLAASVVLRGMEGFGIDHHRRTDRLLTLSEDLPLVSVAVDERARIEAALADLDALEPRGLVTLERARLVGPGTGGSAAPGDAVKLTVYLGRHERTGGRPAHEAVVQLLHDRGVAGASVLLGVDGTVHGERRRARFFGRNAEVPLMVIAVGEAERVDAALAALRALLERPLMTVERVRVCKRDGERLAEPPAPAGRDGDGLGVWQKLMVYAGEQSRHAGRPLHQALVRELREADVAGATTLRGIWGYHGDHAPHGDTFWQLRRRVPVLTVVVDTPERIRRAWERIDALTGETGLVTSEIVPAYRATGRAEGPHGGLELAPLA